MPNRLPIAARIRRLLTGAMGAFALALAAQAAPPAGTVISNQATVTGTSGVNPVGGVSNTVDLTTSALPVAPTATLAPDNARSANPGDVVHFGHVLANLGAAPADFTISLAALPGDYALGSLALFTDEDADGLPNNPLANGAVITLGAGQSFRFVARASVPGGAPAGAAGRLAVRAQGAFPGSPLLANTDTVTVAAGTAIPTGVTVFKTFSVNEVPSPYDAITVTLRYGNAGAAKRDLALTDAIPAGFAYVPGSARWSGAGAPLTDAAGGDPAGIDFDFGASQAGTLTARIADLPTNADGTLTFRMTVAAGRSPGEILTNVANYRWKDAGGDSYTYETPPATYRVTGSIDLTLTGETIPEAAPGSTVVFRNVLVNRGTLAEAFDIALSASTFPAGTVLALMKPDGVTPLADTNGNGVPDTGIVAPGASFVIVVRAAIPATAAPAAYRVTKTATSAQSPGRRASADDVLTTVGIGCRVVIEPEMTGRVAVAQSITYGHEIRNLGNCPEVITFPTAGKSAAKSDSVAGWTSVPYLDNPAPGAVSIVGQLDASDTPVTAATSFPLAPGEARVLLVHVTSPPMPTPETNLTTSRAQASISGALVVTDRTRNDLPDGSGGTADNVLRNFTAPDYLVPSVWGVIGRDLLLRADASACNADPAVAETRTIVITGPGGEREEVVATETGPATGIFVARALPVRRPAVVAGSGAIEGVAGDVHLAEVLGCGTRIATRVTLIEPTGVVFDSRTNAPVPGASVHLFTAQGGSCSATRALVNAASPAGAAAGGAPNPVTTGSDGRFEFPLVASGQYCVAVTPPNGYAFASGVPYPLLPAGRNLVVTAPTAGGSYGNPFAIAAAGPVVLDIPVDAVAASGLFVQKKASRGSVEVGEFVDYEVRVRNGAGVSLGSADMMLVDDLPAGFAFEPGSARRGGARLADPAGGRGPRLVFNLGRFAEGEEATISYRVRVGGQALRGDGVNRVQATWGSGAAASVSNVATAVVQVTPGVFTDRGYILGRVFLDCNANGVQDGTEPGVPGVRLFLEDGTNVITDGEGQYSFYGIRNRTHVLKADRTTLPAGARLAAVDSRHAGDGASRFVDLKAGELHRADFAIAQCTPSIETEVKSRREAAAKDRSYADQLVGQKLEVERAPVADVKALPASGVLGVAGQGGNPAVANATQGFQPLAAPARAFEPPAASPVAPPRAPAVDLEKLLPALDATLAFVDPADGATLPYAQSTIRVKGAAGAELRLAVNGGPVPASRVGKRATLAEKGVQAWEYIGIDLKPGPNRLELAQVDPFGNERGRVAITVTAPDRLARLVVEPPPSAVADGRTPVKVAVRLVDAAGVPVTVRTPVTLEASRGEWRVEDLDRMSPGVQVFVEGGRAEFLLAAPGEPGEAVIRASTGPLKAEARFDFLPELRQLIAAGVIEGAIHLRHFDPRALVPARASDGFEQELRRISHTSGDGKLDAGARAAFFLKGKVKGDFLLTAAYDSDKDTKERLFRDIQPDEYYPVYGDAGQRGFDAQSTSRLYVRVDKGRSWALYGDYTTQGNWEARKLGAYARSLTGFRQHVEDGRFQANVFASRDSTRQQVDEIRANGTSGPYTLSQASGLLNSERVEILVRDRNQPSIVISATAQSRFFDYEIEPLTGRLLFKAPVASVDANLNPVSIRVTYEVEQGGPRFWVGGVDAQFKVTDRIEVGGIWVEDRNPADPFRLKGASAAVKLGERTAIYAEAAETERELTTGKGQAARIEARHETKDLQVHAYAARTDANFDNPGSYLSKGRGESGAKVTWRAGDRTVVRAEALRTEETSSNAVRDGLAASVEHTFDNRIAVEAGVRHARESNGAAIPLGTTGLPAGGLVPDQVTTARAKVTGPVPFVPGASMYAEGEFDVEDAGRRILAVGGEYTMPNRGKAYFRHEFVSSITGPYGLNAKERQNTSVFGVDTEYMRDGRLFSEYRVRDALSGGDTEAAIGLRNTWTVAEGLKLGTSVERVHSIAGTGQNENTALAFGVEYTANPLWKGSTRLELRDAATSESLLHTVGFASKLAPDWTLLARNTLAVQRNKDGGGRQLQDRFQAGLAWRDTKANDKDALARVEHKQEHDTMQAGVELKRETQIVSLHASWKPRRPFLVSGRYAARWTTENSLGLASKSRAQMAGARLTWEFAPKWDAGFVTQVLLGEGGKSRQYGLGVEVGYLVATNLWVSAGYNLFGWRDDDLAAGENTEKGPYLRLRYKFDEMLFEGAAAKVPSLGKAAP